MEWQQEKKIQHLLSIGGADDNIFRGTMLSNLDVDKNYLVGQQYYSGTS